MPVKEKTKTNGSSATVKKTTGKKAKTNGSLDSYHESIEKLAYEIWEQRGKQPSDGVSEWLEAERVVKEKFSSN